MNNVRIFISLSLHRDPPRVNKNGASQSAQINLSFARSYNVSQRNASHMSLKVCLRNHQVGNTESVFGPFGSKTLLQYLLFFGFVLDRHLNMPDLATWAKFPL